MFTSSMTLQLKDLPVQKKELFGASLEEIASGGKFTFILPATLIRFVNISALNEGLKSNFNEVSAEVVDCPDLTQQPFTLASKGRSKQRNKPSWIATKQLFRQYCLLTYSELSCLKSSEQTGILNYLIKNSRYKSNNRILSLATFQYSF